MTGLICAGFALGFAYLTCEPTGGIAQPAAAYCDVASRPRADRKDTPATILRINREYAKWKSLCAPR